MPAGIDVQPRAQGNVIPYGPVKAGTSLRLVFVVTNTGNSNLVFGAIAGSITPVTGGAFNIILKPDGQTIAPGASTTFTVDFVPVGITGLACQATLQINSNAVSGPSLLTLTGIVAANTDNFVQLTLLLAAYASAPAPAVVAFGNAIAGQVLDSQTLVIKNTTTTPKTVTLVPLVAAGYAIINQAGANPIPAGGQITLQLELTAAANRPNQDDVNAIVVTVVGNTYTTNVEATYNTLPILPAFTLTGSDFESLLGFYNVAGASSMLQADASDLNCEEDASFSRQYDFKMPDVEKQLQRLLLRYERLGPATVTVTYSAISPLNQAPVVQTRVFDATVDGLLRNILYDGSIAGDIIQMTFKCIGSQGPVSIALITPYIEPRGEIIEAT